MRADTNPLGIVTYGSAAYKPKKAPELPNSANRQNLSKAPRLPYLSPPGIRKNQ
jgi:hypothetical protein